jgi:hypothetical protein
MKKVHVHTIGCKKVFQHICENLDADLNSPRCREIRAHLDGCENCSAYLDSLKKTVYLYRQYPEPEIPHKTHKELLAAISLLPAKPIKRQK